MQCVVDAWSQGTRDLPDGLVPNSWSACTLVVLRYRVSMWDGCETVFCNVVCCDLDRQADRQTCSAPVAHADSSAAVYSIGWEYGTRTTTGGTDTLVTASGAARCHYHDETGTAYYKAPTGYCCCCCCYYYSHHRLWRRDQETRSRGDDRR